MAIARDPVLEELKRSISTTASLASTVSTLSLEGVEQADIDAVVNRKWRLDEIIGPLRSKMAILSGGRDRRGGPIITITGTEHSNFKPINMGQLLSYLSKVADESIQGLGFTVVLDMSRGTWQVTKHALKALQLTFVEHVHQAYVVKPKAFWQRQRVGMNFTLVRSKFHFPVILLESSAEIFQYLQASQLTKELGGTLSYNHDKWIDTQRTLEKHQMELLGRLDEFERLREQLEVSEQHESLNEARDAVRRHVEAKQLLDKSDLDSSCEAVNHTTVKLSPCTNPDFLACFTRLEELCETLQVMRDRLEQIWTDKGGRLDQILQLRVHEDDTEKVLRWIHEEFLTLAHDHTDIGDSLSTAELGKQSFEDYQTRKSMKYQDVSRVLQMGDRLIGAYHYASDTIHGRNADLQQRWEELTTLYAERLSLFSLSVIFHDKQQKFFLQVERWVEDCMVTHCPSEIPKLEELIEDHHQLKDKYQEMYSSVRMDGHKLIEMMRKPIGESSLPLNFIVGTRHVKEILESSYDEKSWLDEQWGRRDLMLRQALNLRKFQEQAQKVHSWISDKGNTFLSSSNTIGDGTAATQRLLKKHDVFESETENIYLLSNQLFSRAKELASSGECEREKIEEESKMLEEAVHMFAARLDERREIVLHSFEYYQKVDTLAVDFKKISSDIPQEKFNGASRDVEPRLENFQSQRAKVSQVAEMTFSCCERLMVRLDTAMATAKEAGSSVNYSAAFESVGQRLEVLREEKKTVDELCDQREERWKLCIHLNQFSSDVQKHQEDLEAWCSEQQHSEWEVTDNPIDAQLRLETFQRQYDQLNNSYEMLVARGRSIARQINQLDLQLFGEFAGSDSGAIHPAITTVEELVRKMEGSQKETDVVAVPRLHWLQDCLQGHLLYQRSNKLAMALSTLSSSLSHVVGIGDCLEASQTLLLQVTEANQKLRAIGQDVEMFCREVEDCLRRRHYEGSSLAALARNLQEKFGSVSRTIIEKLHLVRSSVEFYQNINNLSVSMEMCQTQFSSKDTGHTASDNTTLLTTLENLRMSVEGATEEVQSQGRSLLERLAAASRTNQIPPGGTSPPMVAQVSPEKEKMSPRHSRRRNIDFAKLTRIDASEVPRGDGDSSIVSLSEYSDEAPDSPTVTPHKMHHPGKVSPGTSREQQTFRILSLLQKMDAQLQKVLQLYEGRKTRLEQSRKVIEFKEGVAGVVKRMDAVESRCLKGKHDYGRSIEEVKTLIKEHAHFEQSELSDLADRIEVLRDKYRSVEASGHSDLNQLRGIAAGLEKQWEKLEKEMKSRTTNLELSLKFQETLFQASNWCQKSDRFLNSMEEKRESCDSSAEAAKLITELSVYLSVTRSEQEERMLTVKEIGNFLHSNVLTDLSNQIEQSTEKTMHDFEQSRDDLERHHAKLAQIENEKDQEKRLHKKREWVLEELLQTEEAYVADLKLIVEKCRPRFVSDLLPNSLKGKEGIIFSNIAEIEKFHKDYLLPKLIDHQGDVDSTAEVLKDSVDDMAAVYVPYCTDKSASEELLASHRTYLFRVQSLFGTDIPLSTLLIKPIQRITKYPLLLRDALKYTTQLGMPTQVLQDALKAVEKIPVVTNNAIHLSLLENYKDIVAELGKLLYQGPLLVSEAKFKIKVEKERQVFAFQSTLLFARKVELPGQAKFKYECKFKIPITSGLQVNEFLEGEPCKFIVTTGDHKLHFRANTIESKQIWVKVLRTSVLRQRTNSFGGALAQFSMSLLSVESSGLSTDLMNPSPQPSPKTTPVLMRKMNGGTMVEVEFEKYKLKEDYHPAPTSPTSPTSSTPLLLFQGDIVEILDSSIREKWYVRTVGGPVLAHGWVPSGILEHVPDEDEPDFGGKKSAKGYVPITTGLSSSLDEQDLKFLKNQKSFGSHDLQSQKVINTLKRVTFGLEDNDINHEETVAEEEEEEEEEEGTSLDRPAMVGNEWKMHTFPRLSPRTSPCTSPLPSVKVRAPSSSPRTSPLPGVRARRFTEGAEMTGDWTKSRWRRTAVIRRRSQGHSVSSDSPTEKMLHSSGSDEAIAPADSNEDTGRTTETTAEEKERVQKAQRKLKFIMMELLETERQYVQGLEECINGYMKEMQSPNLPDALKGKEKLIFGNIQAVYDFHHGTFVKLLEEASESPEDIAKCFLNQAHMFEVYVTYCENKPMSESFLWTFHHNGGTFFEEVKTQLGHRHDIDSYLIKPVQRITRYKLLLGDLYRSAQKAEMETPILERALNLMQDVPKRANDAMTLSMIYGYEGNIHHSGQIILQDEFTVFERSRWTGAKRQLFLLEQRLVITKEKGDDGMYQYKDSLKVHNLSLAEKEGDSPVRFAVGTGPIGSWDQFYILEAGTVEKKQHWLQTIKNILKQQFELLKALKQPNTRPKSKIVDLPDPDTVIPDPKSSVAMINLSDDSEEEFVEFPISPTHSPRSDQGKKPASMAAVSTVGEPTPGMPSLKSRALNLYIVAEDCAPPKENEGILFVHKGQVYDIIDSASDWWFARLVRDITPSPGGTRIAQQGWVPGSFLDKFEGELSTEEESAFNAALRKIQLKKQRAASESPRHEHKLLPRKQHQKLRITNSHTFEEEPEREEEEEEEEEEASSSQEELAKPGEPPTLISHLANETVIAGHRVQLQCKIKEGANPTPNVEWTHNHQPVNIDRAFASFGAESCVIRIKSVQSSDEGMYTCTIWNKHGVATTTAYLTVLSPPDPPGKPTVKPLTSTSVSLSWEPPPSSSHSTIKLYLVECKDTISNRWSTLMKRITEPSLVIDDLMPGIEYAFRVIASNQVGLSEPSAESDEVKLARLSVESDFLLDPFEHRYQLLEEIGRGQYGTVYECLHNATQQTYAAKLIPLEIGKDNARHELDILDKLSHPNILPITSAYITQTHFIILFPHYSGVNVLEYFVRHDCLSEHAAARCVGQVLSALCYLHELNIAHLDIRPENVMTMELAESSVPEVKLINMERAMEIDSDVFMKKIDSSIEYEAPEILTGEPVSMVTDVWSLGVLLYILLCGSSPFLVDSLDLTKDNILSVRYSFHVKYFKEVSSNAKDLVSKMIVKEKSDRLTSTQCLSHPWLASKSPKNSRNLNTARLKSYLTSRKWQHSLGREESSVV